MTTETKIYKSKRLVSVLILLGIALILLAAFLLLRNSRAIAIISGLIKNNDQGKTVIQNRKSGADELDKSEETVIANRIRKGQLLLPEGVFETSPVPETNLNILLIGPDVSEANYDTLMIASINVKDHKVTLINIPRDIYVPYSKETIADIKKVSKHYSVNSALNKINAAHLLGNVLNYDDGKGPLGSSDIDFVADVVSEMFHLYIDDYIYLKPSTFRTIVDDFGGVIIDVPYRMRYSDPYQDLSIDLQPGEQLLNGQQAEGFVRYRKGLTDSGKVTGISDNERKANQVAFMKAFASQYVNLGNLGELVGLLENADDYLRTSINNTHLTAYTSYAKSFVKSDYTIESIEVPTADLTMGGVSFLYLAIEGQNGFVIADGSTTRKTVRQEAKTPTEPNASAETTVDITASSDKTDDITAPSDIAANVTAPSETSDNKAAETQVSELPVETMPDKTGGPEETTPQTQPTEPDPPILQDPGWNEGVPIEPLL